MPAKKAPATAVAVPTQAEIEAQLAPFVANLPAIIIDTDDDYVAAGAEVQRVKREAKKVEDMRKAALAPIAQLRNTVDAWFKPTLNRLELHEDALKTALRGYDQRKEAERRAIEAKLRDEHEAELARATAEAAKLFDQGKQEEADAVLESVPLLPTVVSSKPKLPGISTREYWHAEVTDFVEFLVWAIDHERLDMLQPNEQALRTHAQSTKGTVPIAGVRIYSEQGLAVRA